MKGIAVFKESEEVKRILRHLIKNGRPTPGFYAAKLKGMLSLIF